MNGPNSRLPNPEPQLAIPTADILSQHSHSAGSPNKRHLQSNKSKLEELRKNIKRHQKLGGLGSHMIGSPDWHDKMNLYKKRQSFGHINNILNCLGRKRSSFVES